MSVSDKIRGKNKTRVLLSRVKIYLWKKGGQGVPATFAKGITPSQRRIVAQNVTQKEIAEMLAKQRGAKQKGSVYCSNPTLPRRLS